MPETTFDLDLRPTELDDARKVADLESTLDTSEPSDPARRLHWWRMTDELERGMRQIAERDGSAVAYTSAAHERWEGDQKRYGTIRLMLHHDVWSERSYGRLADVAEAWLRD